MRDKLRAARAWLAKCIADGYVDESGIHDTDRYPEEGWRHLKELAVDRTCATCKWAEAEEDGTRCTRIIANDPPVPPTYIQVDSPQDGSAYLYVAPDFGCVQWEGK